MKRITFLVALLSGCSTIRVDTPPIQVQSSAGEVRAQTPEAAAVVVAELEDLDPKVRFLLGTANQIPARIYLGDHRLPEGRDACVYDGIILLTDAREPMLQLTLAHELVHWHAIEPWTRLPSVMVEGLAELVSTLLSTKGGSGANMARTVAILQVENPDPKLILRMSNAALCAASEQDANPYYGVGLLLATEIGIERLYALCVRARDEGLEQVPIEWLFEASGLSSTDMRKWRLHGVGPLPQSYFEQPAQ